MTVTSHNIINEVYIRNSRKVFQVALVAGCIGLVLAGLFELFRAPYAIVAFIVAALVGAIGVFDRRVKLRLSDAGIRYAQWGPADVPWHEFSAYRWVTWRRYPYLQLVSRRPSQLIGRFSRVGRLNHRLARIVGIPVFSIAVTPLEISGMELASHISRHLPEKSLPLTSACS